MATMAPHTVDHTSPLHFACCHGDTVTVEALLAEDVEVDMRNQHGFTPMHYACQWGHSEVAELLLAFGAGINLGDNRGYKPLHFASRYGHLTMAKALIKAKATLDPAVMGYTPLYFACQRGYRATAQALLEAGAPVDSASNLGATPMHISCRYGHLELVKLLCTYGGDRELLMMDGVSTPMLTAQQHGHVRVVNWLESTRTFSTPLHYISLMSVSRVRKLLREGANVHACRNPGEDTPLSLAQNAKAHNSGAHLICLAAQPWCLSPPLANHSLFPKAARERAAELLVLGHRLSREGRFEGVSQVVFDLWMTAILPLAITREIM